MKQRERGRGRKLKEKPGKGRAKRSTWLGRAGEAEWALGPLPIHVCDYRRQ
jgi:hypothetical protein